MMRGDGLMKGVMEGKMEGKRGRGRKRMGMIDDLLEKERYEDLKRRAVNRQEWRVWLTGTCRMAEQCLLRCCCCTVAVDFLFLCWYFSA